MLDSWKTEPVPLGHNEGVLSEKCIVFDLFTLVLHWQVFCILQKTACSFSLVLLQLKSGAP